MVGVRPSKLNCMKGYTESPEFSLVLVLFMDDFKCYNEVTQISSSLDYKYTTHYIGYNFGKRTHTHIWTWIKRIDSMH